MNFLLFSNLLWNKGIHKATWNYFEAGHGKGAPDGVGASVKRSADAKVLSGCDVTSAEMMCNQLLVDNSSIMLHHIDSRVVEENVQKLLNIKCSPVPGTMRMHQLETDSIGKINYRVLSCFCSHPISCSCFSPSELEFTSVLSVLPSYWLFSPHETSTPEELSTVVEDSHVYTTDTQEESLSVEKSPLIDEYLNQHVVVAYDSKPYPGKVIDIDAQQGDLQISCMHRVGDNRFFWPNKPDICWYDIDNVISIVPEPQHVTQRHYQVSPPNWCEILKRFKD